MTTMTMRLALAGAAFALAALAPAGAATPAAKRADWPAVTAPTDGGHVMGNPAAEVKLVEFMSYTCPHCGEFARTGEGALKLLYIPTGKVSFEVRHLVRDPIDVTAALLANCGSADKFFANHTAIMARQDEWLGKARIASAAQKSRWSNGTLASRFQAIAADMGFDEIMVSRGYSRAEITTCLKDEAKARKIVDTSQADVAKYDLPGTPSFVIGDTVLENVYDWSSLKTALDARI